MGSPSNAIICAQMESPSIGGSVEGKRRLGRPPCQAPVRAWADVKGNDTGSIMTAASEARTARSASISRSVRRYVGGLLNLT